MQEKSPIIGCSDLPSLTAPNRFNNAAVTRSLQMPNLGLNNNNNNLTTSSNTLQQPHGNHQFRQMSFNFGHLNDLATMNFNNPPVNNINSSRHAKNRLDSTPILPNKKTTAPLVVKTSIAADNDTRNDSRLVNESYQVLMTIISILDFLGVYFIYFCL
jgi:hypothetical protein